MSEIQIHIGHHFWGAGNIGDDLMLSGFLRALGRSGTVARITSAALPQNIASQALRFPEISWLPYERAAREEAVMRCDVWLGLGDTPFQMDSGPWFLDHLRSELKLCRRHRKPMFFLGVGVESRQALASADARAVIAYAEHIWTRDPQSAALLTEAGATGKVTAGSDLANVALAKQAHPPLEPQSLGFILNFEHLEAFSVECLVEVLDRASARERFWLVQEVRPLNYSERTLHAKLPSRHQEGMSVLAPDYQRASLDELLAAWPSPERLLTSRYHGGLIGAWRGSRIVAVERSGKVTGLVLQLGIQSRLPNLLDANETLRALADAAPIDPTQLRHLAAEAERCCLEFFTSVEAYRQRPWQRRLSSLFWLR